jgi:hypothetical protein
VVGIFGHQLRALGHKIVWAPDNKKWLPRDAGVNIIVEGFSKEAVASIANGHAQGARFLILATEEPTPKGFNHGTQEEMVRRQELFPEAAKYAEGILHFVPGDAVTRWYAQFAPAAMVELGYADTLVRTPDNKEPAYDFGFFGSLSPRRHKILKKLAKRIGTVKAVRIVADFATQFDRDQAMREAKVIVQIRKFDEMGLVSSSRCNTSLCIGRPIVAEPHLLSKPWDEIVRFSTTLDGFYDTAIMIRGAWRGVHADQFAKFKHRLSPEHCVGRAMREIGFDLERCAA